MKINDISKDDIKSVIEEAYNKFKSVDAGKNASYIPYLKNVDKNLFGISICLPDGTLIEKGDISYKFGIESISKVPTAILALQQFGGKEVINKIGADATGLNFGSIFAILLEKDHPSTPLVNAGAISACSLIKPIGDADGKWNEIISNINNLCGSETEVIDELYKTESDTNFNNRAIIWLLKGYNRIYDDPLMSLDLYTRQCSIGVTCSQLSILAGTIANKGENPVTGKQVFNPIISHQITSMIATVGMYEETGDWMFESGIPAKSGVGGGIIAVYPGQMGICVFSPPLNPVGNSVKGKLCIDFIAKKLGLSIYQ